VGPLLGSNHPPATTTLGPPATHVKHLSGIRQYTAHDPVVWCPDQQQHTHPQAWVPRDHPAWPHDLHSHWSQPHPTKIKDQGPRQLGPLPAAQETPGKPPRQLLLGSWCFPGSVTCCYSLGSMWTWFL